MFVAGGLARATINASDSTRNHIGGAATFFVFLYTMIFGATWLTVPWLYPAEIFPLQVRARGNAWGVVGWSIGNGWTVWFHPITVNTPKRRKFPNAETDRCFCSLPFLTGSMKRRFIFSARSISPASSSSGHSIPSPINERWKKWISSSPVTVSGTGTPKRTLPDSRKRIQISSELQSVMAPSSVLRRPPSQSPLRRVIFCGIWGVAQPLEMWKKYISTYLGT